MTSTKAERIEMVKRRKLTSSVKTDGNSTIAGSPDSEEKVETQIQKSHKIKEAID